MVCHGRAGPILLGLGWRHRLGKKTGVLSQGAEELAKWVAPFRQTVPSAADAQIAVVCAPKRRSQYGARRDLWRIADALLDGHLTPFATVFASQVLECPETLERFRFLLVLDADLDDSVRKTIATSRRPTFRLSPDLGELDEIVVQLRRAVGRPAVDLPPNVIVGYADREAILFERKGQTGIVSVRLNIPRVEEAGRLVDASGTVLFDGQAADLSSREVPVPLDAWQCKVLRWRPWRGRGQGQPLGS